MGLNRVSRARRKGNPKEIQIMYLNLEYPETSEKIFRKYPGTELETKNPDKIFKAREKNFKDF